MGDVGDGDEAIPQRVFQQSGGDLLPTGGSACEKQVLPESVKHPSHPRQRNSPLDGWGRQVEGGSHHLLRLNALDQQLSPRRLVDEPDRPPRPVDLLVGGGDGLRHPPSPLVDHIATQLLQSLENGSDGHG